MFKSIHKFFFIARYVLGYWFWSVAYRVGFYVSGVLPLDLKISALYVRNAIGRAV